MTVRTSFVERFGEENAVRVEEAATAHIAEATAVHSDDEWGTDPFQYLLLVCIGRDCFTRFRKYHGIDATYEDLLEWALEHGDLRNFYGSIPDYIAMICGAYTPWLTWDPGDEPEMAEEWRKRNLAQAHMTQIEHEAKDTVDSESIRALVENGFVPLWEEGPL